MKLKFVTAFLLFGQLLFGQNAISPAQELKHIKNLIQAEGFVKKNLKNNALLKTVYSNAVNLTPIERSILKKPVGSMFTIGNELYKIIHDTVNTQDAFQYIFLDGNTITKSEIDAIRIEITKQYKNGESIENLYQKYHMDTRNTTSDLGWSNYENAQLELNKVLSKHKNKDIFNIDLPQYNWYYVVKNNLKTKSARKVTYIKVKK
jgi:hypothetical protein